VPNKKYQHLIDACGANRRQLAELALVLTGHMLSLAWAFDGDDETSKSRSFDELLEVRAALDAIAQRTWN